MGFHCGLNGKHSIFTNISFVYCHCYKIIKKNVEWNSAMKICISTVLLTFKNIEVLDYSSNRLGNMNLQQNTNKLQAQQFIQSLISWTQVALRKRRSLLKCSVAAKSKQRDMHRKHTETISYKKKSFAKRPLLLISHVLRVMKSRLSDQQLICWIFTALIKFVIWQQKTCVQRLVTGILLSQGNK